MTKIRFTALALVLTAATGCSSILNAVKDAAFKTMQDEATKNGGKAIRIKGGQAYVLEITDPASPINGAKVEIPADAIPASVKDGGISMWGSKEFGMAVTIDTAAGPAVIVNLQIFDGTLADNKLLTPATITVPYYGDKVSDSNRRKLTIDQELENNNGKWAQLTGLVDTAATKLVSGKSNTLSLFIAAIKGDMPLVPKTNTAEVTVIDNLTGEVKCQTSLDLAAGTSSIAAWKYQILNTDGTNSLKYDEISYEAASDLSNRVNLTFKLDSNIDEPAPSGTLDLSSRATWTNVSVTCKGTPYTASNVNAAITASRTMVKFQNVTEFGTAASNTGACPTTGFDMYHQLDGSVMITLEAATTAAPNLHAIVSLESEIHDAGTHMKWCSH